MPTVEVPPPDVRQLQRENERLQRAVHELSMLNDLARAMTASVNNDAVMNTIINRSPQAAAVRRQHPHRPRETFRALIPFARR